MVPALHAEVDDSGLPTVRVPGRYLWELMEYLRYHHLEITQAFQNTEFKIVFHCLGLYPVQEHLDHWARFVAEPSEMEEAARVH